jgi:hypothetical protein
MKDYISFSDEKLMQEIKADNMFAFDILYKKYSSRLYKFGYSIIKSQEETENLIQDDIERSQVASASSIKQNPGY